METISNVASAATKALWGNSSQQPGEEPVSGQTGSGTADEPYDAGNQPEQDTTKTTTSKDDTDATRSGTEKDESTEPSSGIGAAADTVAGASTEERAGVKSGGPSDAQSTQPSVSTIPDPSSAQKPEQKQQGADRPSEVPQGAGESAVEQTKKEAEEAQKQEFPKDPNDHSGEPLGTVPHDGSENKTKSDSDQPGYDPPNKGTGEEYVKSSGMKAEGGDFDAAAPGAGREADRLMEEKGVHHGADAKDTKEVDAPAESGKRKASIGTRLKEKLHIGKH